MENSTLSADLLDLPVELIAIIRSEGIWSRGDAVVPVVVVITG
jgi:hypothetical protein